MQFTLLQKAYLDINALETTCAHFAAAEKTVDKFKGAKMEVAWSGVRSIEVESIAAVRGGIDNLEDIKTRNVISVWGMGT